MFLIVFGSKIHSDNDENVGFVKTEVEARQIVDQLNKDYAKVLNHNEYSFTYLAVKRYAKSNARKAMQVLEY